MLGSRGALRCCSAIWSRLLGDAWPRRQASSFDIRATGYAAEAADCDCAPVGTAPLNSVPERIAEIDVILVGEPAGGSSTRAAEDCTSQDAATGDATRGATSRRTDSRTAQRAVSGRRTTTREQEADADDGHRQSKHDALHPQHDVSRKNAPPVENVSTRRDAECRARSLNPR